MMTTVDDTGRSCSIIHSRLTGLCSIGWLLLLLPDSESGSEEDKTPKPAGSSAAWCTLIDCSVQIWFVLQLFPIHAEEEDPLEAGAEQRGRGTRSNGCLAVVLWLAFPNVLWDIRRRKEPEQLSNVVIETLWSNCVETGSARCMSSILCITGVVLTVSTLRAVICRVEIQMFNQRTLDCEQEVLKSLIWLSRRVIIQLFSFLFPPNLLTQRLFSLSNPLQLL